MTEFEQTKQLAEQGDVEAQNRLGVIYYDGEGVKQDKDEGVRWLTKAAEQGHPSAQYDMGFIHYNGNVVEHDKAESLRWFTKAAEQGDLLAQAWVNKLTK